MIMDDMCIIYHTSIAIALESVGRNILMHRFVGNQCFMPVYVAIYRKSLPLSASVYDCKANYYHSKQLYS